MNRFFTFFAVLALALAWGAAGNRSFAASYSNNNLDLRYRADKMIGSQVIDQQGTRVGEITDLLIDSNDRVVFAVLDPAWGLGFGHRRWVAIPITAISWNGANQNYVLNVPRERLARAPSFDKYDWPDMGDRNWISSIYQFYGLTPYWSEK